MARAGACPACGARIAKDAVYCPSCGRASGAPALLIETLSDDELGAERIERPKQRSKGRRPAVVAGVGLAAALVGGAVAIGLSRGDGGASGRPGTTAPTSEATSAAVQSTSSTLVSEIDGDGPVLGEPSGGTLVALIHRDGHGIVARLDLDTGDAAAHVVPVQRDYARLLATTNSLVISDESSAVVLWPAAHTAVWLNQSSESPPVVLPAAAADQAWLYEPGSRPAHVVLFDTSNGDTLGRVELPLHSTPVGTDPDGRLLLQADEGGTFRFDTTTGQATQLSPGRVVAVGRSVVVEDTCDERLGCAVYARDLAAGTRVPLAAFVGPTLDDVADLGVPALLSPDERYLVAWEQSDAPFPYAMDIFDTATGLVRRRFEIQAPGYQLAAAWTPDSKWLIAKTRDGIEAVSTDALVPDVRVAPAGLDLTGLVSLTVVPSG